MPLGHNRHHQLAAGEGVQNALGLRRGAALYIQPPRLRRAGDHGVVGPAPAAPAAVFIGPLRHLHRVNDVICEGGHHNSHSGGAAAVAADVVRAVGLVGVPLILLVEVDHLNGPVCKADVAKGGNGGSVVLGVLEHPVSQKQAEVLGIVSRQ